MEHDMYAIRKIYHTNCVFVALVYFQVEIKNMKTTPRDTIFKPSLNLIIASIMVLLTPHKMHYFLL